MVRGHRLLQRGQEPVPAACKLWCMGSMQRQAAAAGACSSKAACHRPSAVMHTARRSCEASRETMNPGPHVWCFWPGTWVNPTSLPHVQSVSRGTSAVAHLQALVDGAGRLPQMVHVTAAEHDWLAVVRRAAGAALMHQLSTDLTALAALQPRPGKAQVLHMC